MTPAGTAAGTAVGLARLGQQVATAGVVGTDLIGTVLLGQMAAEGVDVSHVRRDPGAATSVSILPIRSNGERPALHLAGANALLGPADIPWDLVQPGDFAHIGGCDRLPASAGDLVPGIARRARDLGAATSMDVLAPGSADDFRRVSAALPYVDYFLPNAAQPLERFYGLSGRECRDRVHRTLEDISLGADFAQRYPDELSGGERQQVAIARAIAADPELLVCDEVTSALDVSVQAVIVELLSRLQRERQLSLVFITHNRALVRSIAQSAIVLSGGAVVESGSVAQILDDPGDPYTASLIQSIPGLVS
jgi:ABC-type dipeptide/oligopeptide/nickel transport system ATPase component